MLRDHVSSRAGAEGAASYVNTANTNGETALHVVCSRKSTGKASQVDRDIVQALLQSGGDVGLDTYHVNLHFMRSAGHALNFLVIFDRHKKLHFITAQHLAM